MKNLFTQKNSLKESIPLLALCSAFLCVLTILMSYFPFLSVIFTLLLPIPSIIVLLYTKNRYYLIYSLSSVLISILATIGDFSFTIFELIPSLLISFIFANCLKQNFSLRITIILSSFLKTFLNIFFVFLINKILNINFISNLLTLFKIKNETVALFDLTFIFLYSLIEIIIMTILCSSIIKSFNIKKNITNEYEEIFEIAIILVISALSLLTFYFNKNYFYLFLVESICFSIISLDFKEKSLQNSIIFIIFLIITWIFYIIFYKNFLLLDSFVILIVYPCLTIFYKAFLFITKKKINKV